MLTDGSNVFWLYIRLQYFKTSLERFYISYLNTPGKIFEKKKSFASVYSAMTSPNVEILLTSLSFLRS